MTEEEFPKVNPNVADNETLQTLPGIGNSLAQKIMDARPFSELQDLLNIQGLGKAALERLEPLLTFIDPDEDDSTAARLDQAMEIEEEVASVLSPDGQKELDMETAELLDEGQETRDEKPELEVDEKPVEAPERQISPATAPAVRRVKTFSRAEITWLMLATGLVTLFLSVLVSLAVIGGINNTLDFNRVQAVQQLQNEMSDLQGNLESLSASVNVFDERLTPLEGLSGRMITVEDQVEAIQEDVVEALDGVQTMQASLITLEDETSRLTGRVDRFDAFLEGLRKVISELFAAPSAETLPQQ